MRKYIQISYYHDPQETPASCICQMCGGELYEGDVYYDMGGYPVCRDCLGQFARRYFQSRRRRLAVREAMQ